MVLIQYYTLKPVIVMTRYFYFKHINYYPTDYLKAISGQKKTVFRPPGLVVALKWDMFLLFYHLNNQRSWVSDKM